MKWLPPQQPGYGPWIEFTGTPGVCPVDPNAKVEHLDANERRNERFVSSPAEAEYLTWRNCAAYCVKLPDIKLDADVSQAVNALSVQVAGDHYKKLKIQPIEYIHANGIPFAEGSAIKYLTRWRDKGGVDDLKKARHFIDLLIELETRNG